MKHFCTRKSVRLTWIWDPTNCPTVGNTVHFSVDHRFLFNLKTGKVAAIACWNVVIRVVVMLCRKHLAHRSGVNAYECGS